MPGIRNTFTNFRSFSLRPSSFLTTTVTPSIILDPSDAASSTRLIPPLRRRRLDRFASRGLAIVVFATFVSLIFVSGIAILLVAHRPDQLSQFSVALDEVSRLNPGIVLVGEDVDVDVDQPSVTIRWSLVACGSGYVLPGSKGLLGHSGCGLPREPVDIYIDSNALPALRYDPSQVTFDGNTGQRKSTQKGPRFESTHILDVHYARQYPFDNYQIQSELRAISTLNANESQYMSISRAFTIDKTSNFNILTTDFRSFTPSPSGGQNPSQHIDLHIKRPGAVRFFTLLLFTIGWLLTHINLGQLFVAHKATEHSTVIFCLAVSAGSVAILPRIRYSMPDAPGLDGVIIDRIGYFPQMGIVGLCVVYLLLNLAVREFEALRHATSGTQYQSPTSRHFCCPELASPPPKRPRRPPPMYTANSNPTDLAQWEMKRMTKHLKGEFVFPPVPSPLSSPTKPSNPSWKPVHRRSKTARAMTVTEDGEVSRWSDHED